MLGKGLESLIPPKKDGVPQGEHSAFAAAGDAQPSDQNRNAQSIAPAAAATPHVPAPPLKDEGKLEADVADHVFHLETEKISPNPNQPRRNFSEEGIRELANSIREFGFLQPIVVSKIERETPSGVDVRYELIAGERRLLAAKLLGFHVVPAIIRAVDLEREKLELAVLENIQRENLNPVETARAFQRLQEEFRLTQREIAARLGKSRETVANAVRLLDLPSYIQEALAKGEITESHGRFLLAISDPASQKTLFEDILGKKLTTRGLRDRVRMQKEGGAAGAASAEPVSPEVKMWEEKLSSELGTPVAIHKKGDAGKIEITFYSPEELQQIISRFDKSET